MVSAVQSILTIVVTAEFVVGNFANVFITLVNCTDWVKRKRISSVDRILTALAVSRIGLLWVMFLSWSFTLFNPALKSGMIAHFFWTITNHFSTWIATSLSVFYLLKIASFSNLIFLHLKKRGNNIIVLILLWCLVLLVSKLVISVYDITGLKEHKGNLTWKRELGNTVYLPIRGALTVVYFIPIIISIVCFLLLIYSLRKHLRQMHQHSKGSQDISTEVHVKALKTVISHLLLLIMYCLSILISHWNFTILQNESVFLLSKITVILYPSSHSCILIWGNRKLKQAFMLGVQQARCWLKEKEPSSPYQQE
ncbi:PREDICTED: taste receptor type 2 member 31-like [Chinchilla lanigera]|uniref:taste receptor type 2 member 31-like n=1 Tax=Chinchilla lanigera TaxID=34839 RepID=UPI00038EFA33|nr:PREDICTED: taste receptor type 2 member 31-like [Chinchilla lanigera]